MKPKKNYMLKLLNSLELSSKLTNKWFISYLNPYAQPSFLKSLIHNSQAKCTNLVSSLLMMLLNTWDSKLLEPNLKILLKHLQLTHKIKFASLDRQLSMVLVFLLKELHKKISNNSVLLY